MISQDKTRQLLLAQVDLAQTEHDRANSSFWRICGEVPSGLPHLDGAQTVQTASRKQDVTRRALLDALSELNRFLKDGLVSEKMTADQADARTEALRIRKAAV